MRRIKQVVAVAVLFAMHSRRPSGHDADDKLGTVSFPTSCDPKVQAEFRFRRRDAAFVLVQHSGKDVSLGCSTRTRPVRSPIGASPSICWATPSPAPRRQRMRRTLGRAREGTRNRRQDAARADWIEAISVYYQRSRQDAVTRRLVAYNSAMEQLTQKYPDDFEGESVFYALTLQASAPKSDVTYATQIKSAAFARKAL
jgi:hypothetical protein